MNLKVNTELIEKTQAEGNLEMKSMGTGTATSEASLTNKM